MATFTILGHVRMASANDALGCGGGGVGGWAGAVGGWEATGSGLAVSTLMHWCIDSLVDGLGDVRGGGLGRLRWLCCAVEAIVGGGSWLEQRRGDRDARNSIQASSLSVLMTPHPASFLPPPLRTRIYTTHTQSSTRLIPPLRPPPCTPATPAPQSDSTIYQLQLPAIPCLLQSSG